MTTSSEDKADTYARTKVEELQAREYEGDITRWSQIQKVVAEAVRYGQALVPGREKRDEIRLEAQ